MSKARRDGDRDGSEPDMARVTVCTELVPGQTLKVVKLLAYGWSPVRSMPTLGDQVDAALAAAKRSARRASRRGGASTSTRCGVAPTWS
jgi:hypothetical protein